MSEVDYDALGSLTGYLIENGVHGLMPLGTSGEFALLSHDERAKVVKAVVEKSNGRVPVIAGVSDSGTKNAVELARTAADSGASAIILTGPYYYRTDDKGLELHYQTLLNNVDIPLVVYNIPSWTGYNIPAEVVKSLADRNPGRIAGVKFTTNDLNEFLKYLTLLKDEMSIMIGSDSLIFSALELGAAGGVVGSANVLPKETSSIYNEYAKGDLARAHEIQTRIHGFTQAMVMGTYPAALKEAMKLIGLTCGEVRPPLRPLSPQDRLVVRRSLAWKLA